VLCHGDSEPSQLKGTVLTAEGCIVITIIVVIVINCSRSVTPYMQCVVNHYVPFGVLNSALILEVGARGGVVVEALRYKPEGRGFDSRWCH
jgi:hypothetical protein